MGVWLAQNPPFNVDALVNAIHGFSNFGKVMANPLGRTMDVYAFVLPLFELNIRAACLGLSPGASFFALY